MTPIVPSEVEKEITFPIETALSRIPGLQSTRSLSRNNFSQMSAIFDDNNAKVCCSPLYRTKVTWHAE